MERILINNDEKFLELVGKKCKLIHEDYYPSGYKDEVLKIVLRKRQNKCYLYNRVHTRLYIKSMGNKRIRELMRQIRRERNDIKKRIRRAGFSIYHPEYPFFVKIID
jgi:hypothetical protein